MGETVGEKQKSPSVLTELATWRSLGTLEGFQRNSRVTTRFQELKVSGK